MNQDCSDQTLAQLFERQREFDRSATPPFARLSRVARPAPRRLRRPIWAAALAAAAVGVVIFRLQVSRVAPDLPAPVRTAAIAMTTWQPTTDALLPNYTEMSFATPAPLGGSWTDELLPSSASSASQ